MRRLEKNDLDLLDTNDLSGDYKDNYRWFRGFDGWFLLGNYFEGNIRYNNFKTYSAVDRNWKLSPHVTGPVQDFWDHEIEFHIERHQELDPKGYWAVVCRKGKEICITETWEDYEVDDPKWPGEGLEKIKTSDSKEKADVLIALTRHWDSVYLEVAFNCFVQYELHLEDEEYGDNYDYTKFDCSLDKLHDVIEETGMDIYEFYYLILENTIWPVREDISNSAYEQLFPEMFRKAYLKTLRVLFENRNIKYKENPPKDTLETRLLKEAELVTELSKVIQTEAMNSNQVQVLKTKLLASREEVDTILTSRKKGKL